VAAQWESPNFSVLHGIPSQFTSNGQTANVQVEKPLFGNLNQWIGFLGTIFTGKPWVFTIKYTGFLL